MTDEGALRFDNGKLPLHLLPPELMLEVSRVLDYGQKKYTIEYETEWDRLLDVSDVVKIEITTPKNSVVAVTKETSETLILNSQRDKDKIVGIGRSVIQTKLRNTPNVGLEIQNVVNEIKQRNGESGFQTLGLTKEFSPTTTNEVVPYVEPINSCMLIIVTKQGNLEVSFAPNTIMDSDFWETIWKDLCKQFDISKPLNKTGSRNWEKGMDWSRVYSSLSRHLLSWWSGEDNDPETGLSHLSHIGCNIAFLIAYNSRGVGKDDRPSKI